MDPSKLAVKLFVSNPASLDAHELVPVFHRWIQQHSIPDHVLIDVADYMHVIDGPGIMLVSHEANFALDSAVGDGPGLLYNRKRPVDGPFRDHLRTTFRAALDAAARIEAELPGKISFATDRLLFRIYDRLLAPNTAATFNTLKGELESFLKNLYGGPVTLSHHEDPQSLFEVEAKAASSPSVKTLLERVS